MTNENMASPHAHVYNTILVGAGPIGIEVAATLKRYRVDYLHLEAGQIGHSIMRWTPDTVFYSSPEWIALCGIPIQTDSQRQISGEQYLAYMRQLVEILELPIHTFEKVVDAVRLAPEEIPSTAKGARFCVTTESNRGTHTYYATHIILSVGNMQRYNTLNIPGIKSPHVSYTIPTPHTYFQKRLLIIGGKNSALEAALRCWRAGAHVSISYRKRALTNKGVLDRIFLELQLLIRNKKLEFLAPTIPIECTRSMTVLQNTETTQKIEVQNDFVYVAIGYVPDYSLYHALGIKLEGTARAPTFDSRTMETNVPGVYVAGTAIAGNETRYTVFITTCHHHAARIVSSITARNDINAQAGNYRDRDYALTDYDLE